MTCVIGLLSCLMMVVAGCASRVVKENDPKPFEKQTFTNSIGQTFVLIPAGSFVMGSPPDEPGRDDDETQHRVTISRSFYLQTTEVTQGQWEEVMGKNPSYFKNCGDDCPVEMVSWDEAREFIRKLNHREKTGRYRLPTEAEWEYACRAGTTAALYNGPIDIIGRFNAPALDPVAWYGGNSCVTYEGGKRCSRWGERQESCPRCGTHPVAQKEPNTWGLYDMLGNVWEWTEDRCDHHFVIITDTYVDGIVDPLCKKGFRRVRRGGAWNRYARQCRAAERYFDDADRGYYFLGFRIARTP